MVSNKTSIAFFGTSLTQHLEGYVPEIYAQMNLPTIGSQVKIDSWRKRGFVNLLGNRLIVSMPNINIELENLGVGGANSFRVLEEVEKCSKVYDIAFLECGINDILRKFQQRDEAVDINTFRENYNKILDILLQKSCKVICLTISPVDDCFEYDMNPVIEQYNNVICELVEMKKCLLVDVHKEFKHLSSFFKGRKQLWLDGIHLSELGDTMVANIIWDSQVFQSIEVLQFNKIKEK